MKPILFLTLLACVFIGCEAHTIDNVELSSDGDMLADTQTADETEIQVADPTSVMNDLLNISSDDSTQRTLTELYESGRGTLQRIGDATSELSGTATLYQGNDGTNQNLGVHLLSITLQTDQAVAIFLSTLSLDNLTTDDLDDTTLTEGVGFITNDLTPTSLQASQLNDASTIRAIAFVCTEGESVSICGGADLEAGLGEVGDDFIHISHATPSGGFRIYRSPDTYNWMFETTDDYSGSNGPQLFFYLSEEPFNADTGVTDEVYVGSGTSIVLHEDPISSNSGKLSYEIANSAAVLLEDYQTVVLWCDAANNIFYLAQVKSL